MKLKKELTLLDVFCITTGAILSSGLFILPGLALAQAGPGVIISYFLAGLLATIGMFSQAELASAMPKAGGTYFFVARSMGPAVGTIYGIITLIALALKSAFELIGMAAYTALFIAVDIRIFAVLLCLVFLSINVVGIKATSWIQIFMVFIILISLLLYIIKGIPAVQVHRFEPFVPHGISSILVTAGFVFVSYGGLLKVASLAEEIKNPGRVLPLGMILSFFVVSVFYILVIFVTVGVLDAGSLVRSLTPLPDAAAVFMSGWGKILLGVIALMAFSSAVNAGILGASRYPLALSRDELLPELFGRIHARFHTPYIAILVIGVFIIAALFMNITTIIKAASSVLILTYLFACLANIIMRESHLQNYRPAFHAPLYPWLQIIGIAGFGALLIGIGVEGLLASLILVVSGTFVYWFYGRIKTTREFALLHLIERITAKELTGHSLETELKEIVRERDDIINDRFDHVIEESTILDIDEAITVEKFFKIASEKMAERLHVDRDTLLQLLLQREKESSTVLNPDLAIPHIIVDGERAFDILLARCSGGIIFSDESQKVHTVFVLVGTKDERPFHLRALAAIAQIVQDSHFEDKWMKAKNKEALRDLVLLSKRRRH